MSTALSLDLWSKLPGLLDFVGVNSMWDFFYNILNQKVMTLWINRDFKNTAIVYTGAVMSLAMSFTSAAYVIVQST